MTTTAMRGSEVPEWPGPLTVDEFKKAWAADLLEGDWRREPLEFEGFQPRFLPVDWGAGSIWVTR